MLVSRANSNSPLLDTRDLLAHPKTKKYVAKISARGGSAFGGKNLHVLVFKNTTQIEKICAENNWPLLNPPSELANKVEEKISQLTWLGPLTKYLPPHQVMILKNVTWPLVIPTERSERRNPSNWMSKFILQFNRAHTGSGTLLIESKKQLDELKQKFPNREVRVTKFISGPAFTNNNIVWPSSVKTSASRTKNVFIGNINYQITGLSPFTERPFATIGNDWALPTRVLSAKQIKQYKQIATDVGKRLAKAGWKGLFGIDVIMDEKTGKLYLIEINARQPASTTFESQLQQLVILSEAKNLSHIRLDPCATAEALGGTRSATPQDDKITTFEAHLAALLNLPATSYKLQAIANGAQTVLKNKDTRYKIQNTSMEKLKKLGLNIIPYSNTEPESDLLRIQSGNGIMQAHNTFNMLGKTIANELEN